MTARRFAWPAMGVLLVVGAMGAAMLLGDARDGGGTPGNGPGATAGAAGCYLGHLSTDKAIYRIGDRVFFRGVILSALDHRPAAEQTVSYALVQIAGPNGEQISQQNADVVDSTAAFSWDVPEGTAGGIYTATISFPGNGFPSSERKFEVRAYRAPRLKGEIVFLRDGFGPGDMVRASMHVERAEGGIPAGATVSANAIVDGQSVYAGNTTVDAAGNCSVSFPLPKRIAHADGTLSLSVADGGVIEPIAKTIPILLNTVDLAIYPEGGDLVAGLPNRVYLEARTTAQKPADVAGSVVDGAGNAVADFRTEHEGRGRFSFTPRAGEHYAIKLAQPAGITAEFPLPAVKAEGAVLNSASDVTAGGSAIKLNLSATKAGAYTVTLCKRQVELASVDVKLDAGVSQSLALTPPSWADGVLVATVKDSAGTPVAERLVFRRPEHAVHVQVTPDKSSYNPGDAVKVTIKTTDDAGKPIAAVVGITATDDAVARLIEKRDRAPRLAEMALLEDDVRDLADCQTYFDPADPKSASATDLLLGTQGWRRFATTDEKKFLAQFGEAGRRVLADVQPPMPTTQAQWGEDRAFDDEEGVQFAGRAARPQPAGAMLHNKLAAVQEERGAVVPDAPGNQPLVGVIQNADRQLPMVKEIQEQQMQARGAEPVRIYAHELRKDRAANDRADFTDTLYWSAGVKTDGKTGLATVAFALNDSVTSFDITADAFNSAGRLGEGQAMVTSSQSFYVEPKLPLAVSAGDVVHLPIAAVNGTPEAMNDVQLVVTDVDAGGAIKVAPFSIPANSRVRRNVDIHVGPLPGTVHLRIEGAAGQYSDAVTRQMSIEPLGFPTSIDSGGIVAAGSKVVRTVVIPESVVAGSLKTSAVLYPTPLANLTEALKALMQQPNGCFEQTSSTNYPVVMADQYFTTHAGVDPALVAQCDQLMDDGYHRLLGFECTNKGYEWFGQDPGHECLTAYGLLEFTDMAQVHQVDPKMLADTRDWLMARRDGKGGFTHERRSLHTWITDPGCANGYCTWALLETGQTGLEKEVAWLKDRAQTDSNSYVKALAANALWLAGDRAGARQLMDVLAQRQDKDGHVRGATTTVVGSGGDSLEIETTSLATLAWLRDPAYSGNVERSIRYIAESCKAGRFGSTQSTVLALRAIVDYDKARAHPTAAGRVQLFVDGQGVGDAIAFNAKNTGAIKLPDFSKFMTAGQHTVELRMTDGSDLPYSLAIGFNSLTPGSSADCKLEMNTALQSTDVAEGAATEMRVTVSNVSADAQPSPLAIVGIPGGLEVRNQQLKELVKAGRIAAYEVRGRDLILYWRDIQPKEMIDLPISLTAAVPGTYTAPASRTYLYYTDDARQWIAGVRVTVH